MIKQQTQEEKQQFKKDFGWRATFNFVGMGNLKVESMRSNDHLSYTCYHPVYLTIIFKLLLSKIKIIAK